MSTEDLRSKVAVIKIAIDKAVVPQASVAPQAIDSNPVHNAVREALEAISWQNYLEKGQDVLVKLNLTLEMLLPGATTSPWVVEGLIKVIKDYVGKIILADANQVLFNAYNAFKNCHLERLCDGHKVIWKNLSEDEWVTVKVPEALAYPELKIPRIALDLPIITVPVIKTHFRSVISCAIKNNYGFLEDNRHNFHHLLAEILVDICRLAKPRLSLLDATIGMEGEGPKSGFPCLVDRILASSDFVALDAIASKIMGFDPLKIEHIQLCQKFGLGIADLNKIEIVGEDIKNLNLKFKPAKGNFVAVVEGYLRRCRFNSLVFKTGLLDLFRFGAIGWYYIWYYFLAGRKLRDKILRETIYGQQYRKE